MPEWVWYYTDNIKSNHTCKIQCSAEKRYFDLQHKLLKVTYAQAAASHPLTSEMSIQTENAPPVPETDGLMVCPYQPRMQLKPVDSPKEPWAQFTHKQSPSDQTLNCADGKNEGAHPNPKLFCEVLHMDTSENTTNIKPTCKFRRHSRLM
jgi:hypothetical protein